MLSYGRANEEYYLSDAERVKRAENIVTIVKRRNPDADIEANNFYTTRPDGVVIFAYNNLYNHLKKYEADTFDIIQFCYGSTVMYNNIVYAMSVWAPDSKKALSCINTMFPEFRVGTLKRIEGWMPSSRYVKSIYDIHTTTSIGDSSWLNAYPFIGSVSFEFSGDKSYVECMRNAMLETINDKEIRSVSIGDIYDAYFGGPKVTNVGESCKLARKKKRET